MRTQATSERTRKLFLLLVDDDPHVTRILERDISRLTELSAIEIIMAENVDDACRYYQAKKSALHRAGFDPACLVICDGNLAYQTGDELLERLESHLGKAVEAFIFHSDDNYFRAFAVSSRVQFIHKSKPDELITRIRAFAGG